MCCRLRDGAAHAAPAVPAAPPGLICPPPAAPYPTPQAVLSDMESGVQLSGSEHTADVSDGSLRGLSGHRTPSPTQRSSPGRGRSPRRGPSPACSDSSVLTLIHSALHKRQLQVQVGRGLSILGEGLGQPGLGPEHPGMEPKPWEALGELGGGASVMRRSLSILGGVCSEKGLPQSSWESSWESGIPGAAEDSGNRIPAQNRRDLGIWGRSRGRAPPGIVREMRFPNKTGRDRKRPERTSVPGTRGAWELGANRSLGVGPEPGC